MSLKDRFNTSNPKPEKIEIKTELQNTPTTDEVSTSISLGILDNLLEDSDINAIFVNGAKNIFIERKTKLLRSTMAFRDEIQLQNIIKKHIKDEESFVKFNHKKGINVTATIPPLTNTSTISIKCYRDKYATLENLEEQQVLSKEMSIFLETLLKTKNNIIIAGDKKTIKTAMLSALTKKASVNNRNVVVDFSNEIETDKSNFTNFDLSEINSKESKETILKSIFLTNPSCIFMNDFEFDIDCVTKNILNGFAGLYLNIEAKSKEEALDKITMEILKFAPYLGFEEAKKKAYKYFDYIIFMDNKNNYKIKSISEILLNNDNYSLNDIFLLNPDMTHFSLGYTPNMFLNSEIDSINLNIFNPEYKHTYAVSPFANMQKKGLNPEVLKKFKKDLNKESFEKFENERKNIELTEQNPLAPSQPHQISEEIKEEVEQNVEIIYDDEFLKKAQEKFDEVRKNIKNAENNEENQQNL